jgi:hypothetical protein
MDKPPRGIFNFQFLIFKQIQMIKFSKLKTYLYLFGVCFAIISFMLLDIARASTLSFLPQSQDVYFGETFILDARIDTEGKAVNVIQGTIKYPSEKIEIVDVIDGSSIISLWVEKPAYSFSKKEINFTGGIPNGFSGEGNLLKIVFRLKAESFLGEEIIFSEKTKVLLNDGSGTEDKLNFISPNIKILKKPDGLPIISSRSHANQDFWYSDNNLKLHWDLIEGAEYSFLISRDSLAEVDETPDKPEGELFWMGDMNYKGLEDGIYYFNLKQKLLNGEWSAKTTFRVMIDTTKPEEFMLEITEIEGKKYLVFNTRDAVSGVDRYEVKEKKERNTLDKFFFGRVNEKNFEKATSPYLLKDQDLKSDIIVKAIDKAGNEISAEIYAKQKSISSQIIIAVFVIAIMLSIIWLRKKYRKNKK